jgi:predicted secreted protein
LCLLALGASLTAACGSADPKQPPAASPSPQASEPLFKPIDPAAVPVVPQANPNTAALPPAVVPGGGEPQAMVTDMASGWPVTLRVGQMMSARLTADPAAGGRWSLRAGSDAGVVIVDGPPSPEAPAGQPPAEVFRMKAAKPGQTTITFDLKKGADTIRSVSYPVTVQ